MIFKYICIIIFSLVLVSCEKKSEEEKALYEKVARVEPLYNKQIVTELNPAIIDEYRQAEFAINRRYINEVENIIDKDIEEKLEVFEDKELGFFRGVKHIVKVFISSDKEWNDYWDLKKEKYFSNQDTYQKLHESYKSYNSDIQRLRGQISNSPQCKVVPKEVRYNIQEQEMSLEKVKQHTIINLGIEVAEEFVIGTVIICIIGAISSLIGVTIAPHGCLVAILCMIISIPLSLYNDKRLLDSIREQYEAQEEIKKTEILNKLDKSTNEFYDYVSK